MVGHPLAEVADLRRRDVGAGGVVRVADADELGGGGDLGEHRLEVVDVALREGNADLAGTGERRQVRVDRERRPGEEDLVAGLTQRLRGSKQDLAGAVADGNPRRIGVEALGDPAAQTARVLVRIAVESVGGPGEGLDHCRMGAPGRLVGGQLDDVLRAERLPRGVLVHPRLVVRQAGELLGEGNRHSSCHCA